MLAVAAALVLLASPDGGAPAPLRLDPKTSELYLLVHKEGAAAAFAHNHVVRAEKFTGALEWDGQHLERCRLKLSVAADDLVVDEPELRARLGPDFAPVISGTDRASVLIHMLGPSQLDAKKFPAITFESTAFARGDGGLELSGNLTLHGERRAVRLTVKLSGDPKAPVGEAHLKFKTSDYGVAPYSAALGSIRNRDEVELVLKLATTASAAP